VQPFGYLGANHNRTVAQSQHGTVFVAVRLLKLIGDEVACLRPVREIIHKHYCTSKLGVDEVGMAQQPHFTWDCKIAATYLTSFYFFQ
jgi:hypothetical protein